MDQRQVIELILDMGRSGANVEEVVRELDRLDDAAHKAARGTDDLAASTANAGKSAGSSARAMLELGRGVQDFQAAGLAGVVNNFEGLALALGLGSGVAGAATIAAVAVQSLWPQVKNLLNSLAGGDETTAAMASATDKLTEAARKLKERLGELKAEAAQRLQQMEAENAAIERQVKLEEQRAANRERHAREETERRRAAVAMEGAPSLEEQRAKRTAKGRAAELKKLIGGDPEAALIRERAEAANAPTSSQQIEAIAKALEDEMKRVEKSGGSLAPQTYRRLKADLRDLQAGASTGASAEQIVRGLSPQSQKLIAAARQQAAQAGHERTDELLGRFYAGDPEALSRVVEMLPEGGLREQLTELTPAAQRRQMLHNVGETFRGFGRRVRGKAEAEVAAREKKEREKHDEQMKRDGEVHHRIMQQMEEHDAAEIEKAFRKRTAAADKAEKELERDHKKEEAAVQADMRLGRQVGKAAAKGAEWDKLDLGGKIPLIPENATDQQILDITERTSEQLSINQQKMTETLSRMGARLQVLKRIGREMDQGVMPSGLPR